MKRATHPLRYVETTAHHPSLRHEPRIPPPDWTAVSECLLGDGLHKRHLLEFCDVGLCVVCWYCGSQLALELVPQLGLLCEVVYSGGDFDYVSNLIVS